MISRNFLLSVIVFFFSCSPKTTVRNSESKQSNTASVEKKDKNYRASYTKTFSLEHMKLNLTPRWKEMEMDGEATITMHPYFYPADSVVLDAKGMVINEVSILTENGDRNQLKFSYDSLRINIKLDTIYSREQSVKLFIRYISQPEKLKNKGSAAIKNSKGLYFIDVDSLDKDKPTELWTQGETESNSAWFPTIEDPAQKMTQEIYITVDTAFKTLSNGLLISSANNNNGTRTDYWKQSLLAAPYLSMIAVGNFAVVHDRYKNIAVDYYVDPPYEKFAKMIFGNTPEMIGFFSEKLKVPYAWEKFSQVVVHDYISGAMENTTAVVQGTNMQEDSSEYADNNYEDYISHELFHHWFGDLVTCESWSNIALNESFANYSEYLWREYKNGRDDADRLNQGDQAAYLFSSAQSDAPLIRFNYDDREELYDAISYNKGGRILHMLRKTVGDEAFFASLNDYLTTHKFGSAEYTDLRLSFEKITGEDLNWFFNEWFLGDGYPSLNIDYTWNDSLHKSTVIIKQKQNLSALHLFRIPLDVDIYSGGKKERKRIIVEDAEQQFTFASAAKPDLINVDAEKMLLCKKIDNKSNENLIFQYDHAPLYSDRYEAVSKIGNNYRVHTPEAGMMLRAVHDKFYSIRLQAVSLIGELALNDSSKVKELLKNLATKDSSVQVREQALIAISKYFSFSEFDSLFNVSAKDKSYRVKARAFKIIADKNPAEAGLLASVLEKDSNSAVLIQLADYFSKSMADKNVFYSRALKIRGYSYARNQVLGNYETYLKNAGVPHYVEEGVLILTTFNTSSKNFKKAISASLGNIEKSVETKSAGTTLTDTTLTDSEKYNSGDWKNTLVKIRADIEKIN